MFRILLTISLTAFCVAMVGCAGDTPNELVGPNASGLAELPTPQKSVAVQITLPVPTGLNPAHVPPIFHIRWVAKAVDVRWILVNTAEHNDSYGEALDFIRNHPNDTAWSEWTRYAPRDAGGGMTYLSPPVDFGAYVFAVVGRNDKGDVTDIEFNRNAARLLVSVRSTGPLFSVFNRYIGTIRTATVQTPPTIMSVISGTAMSFRLSASAEAYGGIVVGYRYGWDILDLEDDEQWEIDFTPFVGEYAEVPARSFFFGSHSFHTEVIDDYGYKSRVHVQLNVLPAIMDKTLLVVDDWVEGPSAGFGPTNGALPSDAEHDAFWLDMVSEVDGFDPARDVIEVQSGQVPPLHKLLDYQNIIWNAPGSAVSTPQAALGEFIRFVDPNIPVPSGSIIPDYISMYMEAGGHVMLCGGQIMTIAINRTTFTNSPPVFPLIFRYELGGDQDGIYSDQDIGIRGVGDDSFPYRDGCLNVLDIAYLQNPNAVRRPPNQQPGFGCPVDHLRDHGQNLGAGQRDGIRTTEPIDLVFPRLELRPEVAGDPSKWFHESRTGLNSDLYNPMYFSEMTQCGPIAEIDPPRDCFQPIYGNDCLNQSSVIYNAPIAYWTAVYEDRVPDVGGVAARSTIWGFDPVYFNPAQAREAMNIILFDEWQLPRILAAQNASKRMGSVGQ